MHTLTAEWQVMCTFKALHRDPEQQHAGLSRDEFYSFYEMIGFKWKQVCRAFLFMTVLVLHIRTCTARSCSQTLLQRFDDAVITFILPDEGDHTCSKLLA